MAVTNQQRLESFKAEADLSASRHRIVVLGTNADEVDLPALTTDMPIGTVENFVKGTIGQSVTIATGGAVKVEANAAITKGASVGIGATDGRAAAKTVAGDWVLGYAREAAAAQGDIIEIMITGPFKLHS